MPRKAAMHYAWDTAAQLEEHYGEAEAGAERWLEANSLFTLDPWIFGDAASIGVHAGCRGHQPATCSLLRGLGKLGVPIIRRHAGAAGGHSRKVS